MSFTDRVQAGQNFDARRYVPFQVDGQHCGWIRPVFAEELKRWPAVFVVCPDSVCLHQSLTSSDQRTDAVAMVVQLLHEQGQIAGWRNEPYPVAATFGGTPLLTVERAAARAFGIRTRGAHLNGYTGNGTACRMWVARRSASKPIDPSMRDNLVGGGIAQGMTPQETILKECGEEAGIPLHLARKAKPCSEILVCREVAEGVHWETLYTFDLHVDEAFVPANQDGEVAEFQLLPIRAVRELVRDTAEFTVDAALVALDFMLRHEMASTTTTERALLLAALYGTPKPAP